MNPNHDSEYTGSVARVNNNVQQLKQHTAHKQKQIFQVSRMKVFKRLHQQTKQRTQASYNSSSPHSKPPLSPARQVKHLSPPPLEATSSYDTDTSSEKSPNRHSSKNQSFTTNSNSNMRPLGSRRADRVSHRGRPEHGIEVADKDMQERAQRAKELLSQRYKGLKTDQVCLKNRTQIRFSLLAKN